MIKHYYLKCLTPDDVVELVRQTLDLSKEQMKNIQQTYISKDKCAIMFDMIEGKTTRTVIAKLSDYECKVIFCIGNDRKTYKKKYAELFVPMIAEKNKQGKIIWGSVEYKKDYNLYHKWQDNKCRSEKIKPEEDLEDIVLK